MQKIDRLGWASGIFLTSYGLKIGIRANTPEVPQEVYACLPPGWESAEPPYVDLLFSLRLGHSSPGSQVRQYHLAYVGLERIARTMDRAEVFEAVENRLQLHVAEYAEKRIFVHAGVVGWRGKAIVLPGRSFAGKSTLVAELLRAGATYYSDEYAVLDENGLVHPYPRRLALRQKEKKFPRRCTAEELNSTSGGMALPIGVVALMKYQPGATWQPRLLTPGRAVIEMLNHTVPVRERPVDSLASVQRAITVAKLLKGPRGEAEETAQALLQAAA